MKLGDKAKSIIATVAPTVATALGGPLAGMAAAILADVVGGGDASTVEKAILSGNPDVMLKLKEADNTLVIRLRELDIEELAEGNRDRANARELFKVNQGPQIWLSMLFIGGYFFALFWAVSFLTETKEISETAKTVITLLLGVITREVPTIMQFWFGSSSGSKNKDEGMIRNITDR